jgi:hypothetical protein
MLSRLIKSQSQRVFYANTTAASTTVCLILIVAAAAFVVGARALLDLR